MQLQTVRTGPPMQVSVDRRTLIQDHDTNGAFFCSNLEVRNLYGAGTLSVWSEKAYLLGTDDWRQVRKAPNDPELEDIGSILVKRVPARCQVFISSEYFVLADEGSTMPELEALRKWRPPEVAPPLPQSDVLMIPGAAARNELLKRNA